jgi:putative SOS response-associated peptidase YedK
MCGRAKLPVDYTTIKNQLGLSDSASAPNFKQSWNIAPTQDMVCVRRHPQSGERVAHTMRWGLIPEWNKTERVDYPTFNARADGIDEKPTFRGAWKAGRRCLIVTDGFYEWRKADRQPYCIVRANAPLTIMAGLWEIWKSASGEQIRTCTIITTDANDLLAPLHHRMPVILAEEDFAVWLGEKPASDAELKALLKPYPSGEMKIWPVNRRVGNVRNDDAALAEPITL